MRFILVLVDLFTSASFTGRVLLSVLGVSENSTDLRRIGPSWTLGEPNLPIGLLALGVEAVCAVPLLVTLPTRAAAGSGMSGVLANKEPLRVGALLSGGCCCWCRCDSAEVNSRGVTTSNLVLVTPGALSMPSRYCNRVCVEKCTRRI